MKSVFLVFFLFLIEFSYRMFCFILAFPHKEMYPINLIVIVEIELTDSVCTLHYSRCFSQNIKRARLALVTKKNLSLIKCFVRYWRQQLNTMLPKHENNQCFVKQNRLLLLLLLLMLLLLLAQSSPVLLPSPLQLVFVTMKTIYYRTSKYHLPVAYSKIK